MAGKKTRSRPVRWLRRALLVFAAVLACATGFAAYVLGTASGGRMAVSLVSGFLPDDVQLEAGEFSGRLFDRFELVGLQLRLPGIEFTVDRVEIEWRSLGMLRGRLHANSAAVDGLRVRVVEVPADSRGREEITADSLPESPVGDLPFDISFDSVTVTGATVELRDSVWVSEGRAVVRGSLDDYRLSLSGHADVPDLASAQVDMHGVGSSTGVHLEELEARTLDGSLRATGDLTWWPGVSWNVSFEADSLRPAGLLPDPEEWPGTVSLVGSSTGRLLDDGGLALDAEVDTVYGELRGEAIGGRFEAHIAGMDIEIPASRIDWGASTVEASGSAGEILDLEFDATVPDLSVVVPGGEGRLRARGRATGPRESPRIRASFEAEALSVETVRVQSASGEVDVDLSGPVAAGFLARELSVAGRPVDSATVVLTGRRAAHRIEALARGPGGELEVTASGGLSAANAWSGTLEAFRVSADTVGTWTLNEPVQVLAAADVLRFGSACFESAPTRVCAEGEISAAFTALQAAVDSLAVERLSPWMPENLSAEAILEADLDLRLAADGELTGTADIRTSAGSLTREVRGETRSLSFEPIEFAATSGADGLRGTVELHVTDSTGVRVLDVGGRVESPLAIRSADDVTALGSQPFSLHLEAEAADLLLVTDNLLPSWDVSGSFRAVADLELGSDRSLTGSLEAGTESLVLRNTVRGQGWTLTVDPARLVGEVGPDGVRGALDLTVHEADQSELVVVSGRIRLPGLTTLPVNPEEQPVEGNLEVRLDDISLIEAFLIDVAEARGSFLLTSRVGGTLAEVTVDGDANLTDGYALLPTVGLELTDIQFTASGRPEGTVEVNGQVRSGEGILTMTGRSERYPSAAEPSVFQVRGERFLVMDIPEVNLLAEPNLSVAFDGTTARLTGEVAIPRGRLGFPELPPSALTPSEDVVIAGDTTVVKEPPVPFGADITVTLGDDVFFNGFGFASNLVGSVRIQQEPKGQPRGRGEVRFVNGTFRSFGQELRVEPGRLLFAGPIDDPAVDARAFVRASDGTEAGFRIGGTVQDLDVSTYSVPPKSDSDVMAYILFGRPMNQTTSAEGNEASNSAAVLGANMLTMSLAPSIGLDEARIDTGTSQNKAQLVVGKYLSPRLYVGYGVGIYEPISTLRLRYLLTARWSIEAITGDQQSTDLLWRIETGGPKREADAPQAGEEVQGAGEE